ncbi:ABC transporter permease [Novispirillum itersonii subsp. nipponicum]
MTGRIVQSLSVWGSVIVLTGLVVIAVLAPLLAPYEINDVVGGVWDPASRAVWLGTDVLGRDLLSRLIWGTRVTLFVAVSATVLAFLIGGSAGIAAGLLGGWVDAAISAAVNLIMSAPTLILALIVLSVMPNGLVVLILVMALLDATRVYRISRSLAQGIAAMDYVEAAWLRGERWWWILLHEIFPNVVSPLLAEFGLRLVFAVLFLSTLSFLGLGIQPPETDWGSLLRENKDGIIFGEWSALISGAVIVVLSLSVTAVLDGFQARSLRRGGQRS